MRLKELTGNIVELPSVAIGFRRPGYQRSGLSTGNVRPRLPPGVRSAIGACARTELPHISIMSLLLTG
jgi:hypothetical protein